MRLRIVGSEVLNIASPNVFFLVEGYGVIRLVLVPVPEAVSPDVSVIWCCIVSASFEDDSAFCKLRLDCRIMKLFEILVVVRNIIDLCPGCNYCSIFYPITTQFHVNESGASKEFHAVPTIFDSHIVFIFLIFVDNVQAYVVEASPGVV